ncbi:MAG: glycosyltransferase [Chloroflexota bacterium]
MRVGLVVPGFSANVHDWCIPALRDFARALSTRDDLRVIAVRYPFGASRYAVDAANVIAVGGAQRRGVGTLGVWGRTLEVIRAEHRRAAFDILHAFWATESGLLTAMAGQLLGIPTLVSLAGGELVALSDIGYGDQRMARERLKIRASLRLASGVTCGSDYLLALARRHVPSKRLYRAPLGVDLELFNPDRTPADKQSGTQPGWAAEPRGAAWARQPRLVHVATLTHVKDQATLLRAFSILRAHAPSTTLDMVGDGPLRSQLEELASELGVAPAVRFHGAVAHAALPQVYRAGSAFALSSRHEAQSMAAIEAAACGLPVVGTRVGVIPELAATPDAVVPVGAAAELAKALGSTLAGAPGPSAADSARASQARVRAEFGLDACVARFRALYAQLADRAGN